MSDFVRPGPASIPAGESVGGVVIHVYGVPDGVLLHVGRLGDHASPADVLSDIVTADNRSKGYAAVCLVAYDGDTGERMTWPHGEGLFTTGAN